MQRLRHWTRGRLQEEGLAVFGVVARPRGRLFKEHILRFTLPARKGGGGGGGGKGGEGGGKGKYSGAKGKYGAGAGGGPPGRAPPLHFHRLGPGDIISITPDRQNPLGSSEVIEGLVLERGPFFIDVVVKEIPPGVVYKRGDPTGGERFRLDLYLNRISFQRMVAAVHQVTGFETGFTVSTELRDILVKSFAERFDVLFPSAPQHQHASHHPSSLVAMSPYTGAKRGGDPRRVTASRERERGRLHEEEAEQARRTRAKAQRKAAGAGGGANGGAGPSSSWEAMASGVPKTFYGRKEADKAVSEEVERFGLNESQEAALRMALARKLSLIQGPPGTGKTRTACHLINIAVRLQRRRGDGKVLAVAFSNVAADNLLEGCLRLGLNAVRVGRAATVRPELRNHTLDALLANHESVATFKKKLEGARQAGSTSTEIQAAKRDLEDAELLAAVSILGNADVVVSTCVGAANEAIVNAAAVTVSAGPGKGSSPLRAIKFPTVIVDEASQATEPATLVPLTQGCEQLVLVGDHYQLPPTIKSFRAQQQGLGVSMFTRLALAGIRPSMLTVQYRMHPLIAQFPSRRFYGGLLQTHPANKHRPRPEGFPWPNPQLPVAFVAVGGDEDASSMGPFFEQRTSGNQTSYLNRKEGEVLVDVLNGVLRRGHVQCKDVGEWFGVGNGGWIWTRPVVYTHTQSTDSSPSPTPTRPRPLHRHRDAVLGAGEARDGAGADAVAALQRGGPGDPERGRVPGPREGAHPHLGRPLQPPWQGGLPRGLAPPQRGHHARQARHCGGGRPPHAAPRPALGRLPALVPQARVRHVPHRAPPPAPAPGGGRQVVGPCLVLVLGNGGGRRRGRGARCRV